MIINIGYNNKLGLFKKKIILKQFSCVLKVAWIRFTLTCWRS